jgi:hypothetical protein
MSGDTDFPHGSLKTLAVSKHSISLALFLNLKNSYN